MDTRRTKRTVVAEEVQIPEKPSPLSNGLILDNIMSYLRAEDLKSVRLVNSKLNPAATRFLKRKTKVILSDEFIQDSRKRVNKDVRKQIKLFQPENVQLFPNDYDDQNWTIVQKLMNELVNGLKYIDFKTIMKTRQEIGMTISWNGEGGFQYPGIQTSQFFALILNQNHPNLVHLRLGVKWCYRFPNHLVGRTVIPSLKRIDLIMDSDGFPKDDETRLRVVMLMDCIANFGPNLETLRFLRKRYSNHRYGYSHGSPPFISSNSTRREVPVNAFLKYLIDRPKCWPHLKNLAFDDLKSVDIVALSNLPIKLNSLKLNKLPTMPNFKTFGLLLKNQQATLEALQFGVPYPTGESVVKTSLTIPHLPKLKKLKIVHDSYSLFMNFEHEDFGNQFPVLQKLSIKEIKNGSTISDDIWTTCPFYKHLLPVDPGNGNAQICKTLRVLKLPYLKQAEQIPEGHDLFGLHKRLSIMFPNVQNSPLEIARVRVAAVAKF